MPVQPPNKTEMARVAEHYGLDLDDRALAEFAPVVEGLLNSWNEVEELYAQSAPTAPERRWQRPEGQDNPYNAWYVTTEIIESEQGPLAGRTAAVKDNTMVAGVPMMNGSATVEGFVPTRDASVVSRMLAAGTTIAGKAVCEDLCFSGGSHTSRTGPVRNPWDETRMTGGSSSGSAALVASGLVDLAIGGDQGGSVRIPRRTAASWGTSPRTAWSPTPAPSR